jgi:hypothetical protein
MQMRLSNMILVLSLGGIGAAGALVGCGSDSTTGSTSSNTGGSGSTTTGATTTTGAGSDPCSPSAACPGSKSECLGLVDYSGKTQFTLRMADLTLTAPPPLTTGLVSSVVKGGVTINLPECNLAGGGTFSWLLQFDTATGKLKAGGAKPTKTPAGGYSFVDETIAGFKITPFETDAPVKEGKFAMATGADLTVPIYIDAEATQVVLLPLHSAKLSGTISANNNCIGQYNSKGLQPGDNCTATKDIPAYIGADGKSDSDGTLDGYITLEEADTVLVDAIKQSLCVILSGDATQYGDGAMPTKCKRDAGGKITFQGDWCAASNDATCKDAVKLKANFAASSVKVN